MSFSQSDRTNYAPTTTVLQPRPPTAREPTETTASPMLDPPRTGTNNPLIHPPPSFINITPPHNEGFLIPEHKPPIEIPQRKEAYRFTAGPNTRIVYDSIDSIAKSPAQTPRNLISILQHGNISPYYTPINSDDRTLSFESRFESGNLRRAIFISESEYDLILKPDSSKKAYTQWFFFSVSNFRPGLPYTFNIINMYKPDSLHNYGMQPVVYSHIDATTKRIGWVRGGEKIMYYKNGIKRSKYQSYYTLTFSYVFKHADDLCYFAYCYPYTYSNLQTDLMMLEADPERRKVIKRRPLCQTTAGNACELLTITSFSSTTEAIRNRKGIVVTSRVHPGESCASWIMKGFINFITGPSPDARFLRENFVFKVIPILNPDGVINGSYRCSLYGDDLNRNWDEPSKAYHPTIYHAKIMIQNLLADRPIMLFCDIHGHSRKRNVFMYGCGDDGSMQNREDRVFPRLLEIRSRMFSFVDSRFTVHKSKLATARVVMRREFDITNSYTLEASLAGYYNSDAPNGVHFNMLHFQQMGETFCMSLIDFVREKTMVQSIMNEAPASSSQPDLGSDDSDYSSPDDDQGTKSDRKGKKKSKKQKPKKPAKPSFESRESSMAIINGAFAGDTKLDKSPKFGAKFRHGEESILRPTPPMPRSASNSVVVTPAGIAVAESSTRSSSSAGNIRGEEGLPSSGPQPVCLKERLRRLHQAANEYFLRSLQTPGAEPPMETKDPYGYRFTSRGKTDDDARMIEDEPPSSRILSARVKSVSEIEPIRQPRNTRPNSASSIRNFLAIRRMEPSINTINMSEQINGFLNPYPSSKLPRIPRPLE